MTTLPAPIIHPIADTEETGNRLFVCRDDLLPQGLGGNKVRLAYEFLADMKRRGCDCLVAYGNTRSNLCRVLATLCSARRIPCFVICSREPHEKAHAETSNSRIMRILGAELVFCEKDNIAPTVESLLERLRSRGLRPYYIYGNKYGQGNEGVPALAYAKAYPQIMEAASTDGERPDLLFHASGTGATQAGLVCGRLLAGDEIDICGVLIASRTRERALEAIRDGVTSCMELLGETLPGDYENAIHLLCAYTAGGYGLYDEDILACIRTQLRANSLPLDPVYTGKAFRGMIRYLKENGITGKKVLFLHTGGTPLFYDALAQSIL